METEILNIISQTKMLAKKELLMKELNSFVRRVTWLCAIFWRHYEMRENSHAHSTATTVHSNKLTVSIKRFREKKILVMQKPTLWIKFAMKTKFWRTWRLVPLTPGVQGKYLAHRPAFAAFTSVWPVYLVDELVLVF